MKELLERIYDLDFELDDLSILILKLTTVDPHRDELTQLEKEKLLDQLQDSLGIISVNTADLQKQIRAKLTELGYESYAEPKYEAQNIREEYNG